ncbi:hypothetical protein AY601_1627 [Pedobacter cryoconitis]|uniref:ABC-2 type transport system permease protein n=1 Tax=Pedobacter cryoconitis TaxID=188932 RepID=A0A127VAX1_9SPHI|nr:DUF3526 domain-containing protein [Pedobacter cryoconitis]AMP98542.1 hypothetical protein AY601_1627 [Pedobacter cryoconitis]
MINYIYQLEFKLFFSSKAARVGLLILLISGFSSIYLGKSFIVKQRSVIEKAGKMQQEHLDENVKYFSKDLGLLLFYNKFAIANVPDNWAAFANGQRDINPYLLSVTLLGLEGQMYDTDLNNPSTLLLGNMDLAFVFIFLFPLVIIAFTYSVLSAEQESGVWGLIRSQSKLPLRTIWRKLVVRVLVVFAVFMLLMFCAVIYLDLKPDLRFLVVLTLISLYLICWFCISFWIISYGKSSSFNAVCLIAIWVAMNIISPAILNVWLTKKYPVPEALENVVKQREGYHEKWDLDKSATMDKFYQHYPQFRQYPFPSSLTFSWYWYYAMQQMGDDDAALSSARITEKLKQRQHFTNIASLFLPGIQTQAGLNELAGSDLQNHTDFLLTLRAYHEKMRLFFYPSVFKGSKVENINWKQFKIKQYSSHTDGLAWQKLLSLIVFSIVPALSGVYNFSKRDSLL